MEWTDKASGWLILVTAFSGLILSWLAYRRQGASAAIEDQSKAYETLRRDYDRQAVEIKSLRSQLERTILRLATQDERLDIARGIVEKLQWRIEVMEVEMKRLRHLETND